MKKLFKLTADILLPVATVEMFNHAPDASTLGAERLCLFAGTAMGLFVALRAPRYARVITNMMSGPEV